MRADSVVNAGIVAAVVVAVAGGCAEKEIDPIDQIKSLIPVIEQRLNKRDLAGLKGMGTVQFESNAFVIDVFGEQVRDTVTLSLSRVQIDGADATLMLHLTSLQSPSERRQLNIHLQGDGKWKIDRYEIIRPQGDTLNPDTGRGV